MATTPTTLQKKRVLSGMRPTGKLHIGHYFGALENWVRLQNDPTYDCFYFIADWHALTSDYADTSAVAQNTIEIVTDYLASGLDPQKSVLFQQSLVPEHAELHLLLGMVTPLGWLERVPTYKEQIENVTSKDLHTYGFLGYPALQTADIVMYSEPGVPLFVPVGEDQVSHVELSREMVRRFNLFFGFVARNSLFSSYDYKRLSKIFEKVGISLVSVPPPTPNKRPLPPSDLQKVTHALRQRALEDGLANFMAKLGDDVSNFEAAEVLTEPDVMLTKTPRVPGLDGRKMSKSYGNAISLSESDDDIRKKTKVMVTDPARKRRTDPGNPNVCPVYDWHKLFSPQPTLDWAAEGCRTAGIGCIECKAKMADYLIQWITPIRDRRVKWENNQSGVLEIIEDGSKRAREVAKVTMSRVREAVFGWTKKLVEIKSVSVNVHDTHD